MARYYKFLIVNVLVFFCVGTATLQSFLVSFASKANHQNVLEIISSSFPSAGPFYVGWSRSDSNFSIHLVLITMIVIFTTGMHGGIELVLCESTRLSNLSGHANYSHIVGVLLTRFLQRIRSLSPLNISSLFSCIPRRNGKPRLANALLASGPVLSITTVSRVWT